MQAVSGSGRCAACAWAGAPATARLGRPPAPAAARVAPRRVRGGAAPAAVAVAARPSSPTRLEPKAGVQRPDIAILGDAAAATAPAAAALAAKWSAVLAAELPALAPQRGRRKVRASGQDWTPALEAELSAICAAGALPADAAAAVVDWSRSCRLTSDPAKLRQYVSNVCQLQGWYGVEVAGAWVARYPGLIRAPPDDVRASLRALLTVLELPPDGAMTVCTRFPALLTVSAATLRANFGALSETLGAERGPEYVRAVARTAPLLLAMRPETLRRKMAALLAHAAREPAWAASVPAVGAKSLAVMLTYGSRRLRRFDYLPQRPAGEECPGWAATVLLSEEGFARRLPGYAAWAAAQGPPGRTAAPAKRLLAAAAAATAAAAEPAAAARAKAATPAPARHPATPPPTPAESVDEGDGPFGAPIILRLGGADGMTLEQRRALLSRARDSLSRQRRSDVGVPTVIGMQQHAVAAATAAAMLVARRLPRTVAVAV